MLLASDATRFVYDRDPTRRVLRLCAVIVIALLSVVAFSVPANATVTTNKCQAFLVLITARGVNAPAGTSLQNGRVWLSGGHGAQLAPLVSKARSNPDYSVFTESLAWAADLNVGDDFYEARVLAGAHTLVTEIESIVDGCAPYLPNIALAGHSGGAHVITKAMYLLPSSYRTVIDAVILYGDPSTNSTQTYNAKGVSSSTGFFHRTNAETSAVNGFTYYGWSYDYPTIQTPTYYPSARAYCNTNDWACRNPIAGLWDAAAHNAYTGYTQDAFNFIDFRVTDFG